MSLDNIIKETIEDQLGFQVQLSPTRYGFKIEKTNEFDITLWLNKHQLVIGVLNSYKPGNGRKIVESLKLATNNKYTIVANKTESIGFWEKMGFYESYNNYPDYEYSLR